MTVSLHTLPQLKKIFDGIFLPWKYGKLTPAYYIRKSINTVPCFGV